MARELDPDVIPSCLGSKLKIKNLDLKKNKVDLIKVNKDWVQWNGEIIELLTTSSNPESPI